MSSRNRLSYTSAATKKSDQFRGPLLERSGDYQRHQYIILILIENSFYWFFIVLKTVLSYRSGVASISQDIADSTALTILLIIFVAICSIQQSYIRGVHVQLEIQNFHSHKQGLSQFYTYCAPFSHYFSNLRFILVLCIAVVPVDPYTVAHFWLAGITAVVVVLFEMYKLIFRYQMYEEALHDMKVVKRLNCEQDMNILPYEFRTDRKWVLISNVLFIMYSMIMLILYVALSISTGNDSSVEETTAIAVTEHLFFATIPLGMIFNLAEIHD